MNTLESLTGLFSNNTQIESTVPVKRIETFKKTDKNDIWDADEILDAVDIDPRPCPE